MWVRFRDLGALAAAKLTQGIHCRWEDHDE